MKSKELTKKIFKFIGIIGIIKGGIKFWLESNEKAYKLDLYRIKKIW